MDEVQRIGIMLLPIKDEYLNNYNNILLFENHNQITFTCTSPESPSNFPEYQLPQPSYLSATSKSGEI
jgi:hypothetical protein